MAIKLHRKGVGLTREERIKEDENITMIEQGINGFQSQLNELVVRGDSSPQATQASVGADGTTYDGNLKARLDAEHNKVTAGLAEKLSKGNVSVFDINKNLGKFDQTYMSPEFLQQMAGNTPVNAVPADGSITNDKLAIQAVDYRKTDFVEIGNNLFNKHKTTANYGVSTANGALYGQADLHASEFIPVTPSTNYYKRNGGNNVAYYDQDKKFISAMSSALGFTTPPNCYYIRTTIQASFLNEMMINAGDLQKPFEEFYQIYKHSNKADLIPTADIRPVGKNILDTKNATVGKRINSDGKLVDATTAFSTSGLLVCEPTTQYATSSVSNVLELDKYKKPVFQGYHTITGATGTFTTKSTTRFLIVTFTGTGAWSQIERGAQYTGYEKVRYGLFTNGREVQMINDVPSPSGQIPVLTQDPTMPAEGQIWINVGG